MIVINIPIITKPILYSFNAVIKNTKDTVGYAIHQICRNQCHKK